MNLSQAEWKQKHQASDKAIIIDVRTPEEWEEGVVAGAKLLNIFEASEFMTAVAEMDKTNEYFVYCRSGARSGQACQILKSQGISSAYNLTGGILEWEGQLTQPDK